MPGVSTGSYQTNYNNAYNANMGNYQAIVAGYNQALAQQTSSQQAISSGYTGLYNTIMGQVGNMYSGQQQQLENQAAQTNASMQQGAISKGLSNTSLSLDMQQGVNSNLAQNESLLAGQEAGTYAQYGSQIGEAALNSAQQGQGQYNQLAQGKYGNMAQVSFPYPNAAAYGQGSSLNSNAMPQVGYVPSNPSYGSGGPSGDTGGGSFAGAAQPAAAAAGSSWNQADPNYAYTGAGDYSGGYGSSSGESDYGSAPNYGAYGEYGGDEDD